MRINIKKYLGKNIKLVKYVSFYRVETPRRSIWSNLKGINFIIKKKCLSRGKKNKTRNKKICKIFVFFSMYEKVKFIDWRSCNETLMIEI